MQIKIQNLQNKYRKFIYENYYYKVLNKDLEISFCFKIEPNIFFEPKIIIKKVGERVLNLVRNHRFLNEVNNLVFHLGLIELLSYWKATCSPKIEIQAEFLNKEQIGWWKDLILNGMGQFFYENKINFTYPNFFKIVSPRPEQNWSRTVLDQYNDKVLVPVGGGKDSVVTLELLKRANRNIRCFSLNPTNAALKIMKIAGCKNPIIVKRKIDPKLLELNRQGFLNGHTPFSAYLSFLSVLVATIFGQKYIAFSNERSSNEGNLKYLGKIINHQYSKSFDFEKKFRDYGRKYLLKDIEYFSFLRPLYEIQIARLFYHHPKYFKAFLSCNEAYKTDSGAKRPPRKWCGKCPKCLFVFTILYSFVAEKKLLKIFGKNLFSDKTLLPIMQQLVGMGSPRGFKPFECVGTQKESLIAFYLSWKKYRGSTPVNLPYLLEYFEEKIMPKYPTLEKESKKLMNSWNNQNNLPQGFKRILKWAIS